MPGPFFHLFSSFRSLRGWAADKLVRLMVRHSRVEEANAEPER